MIIIELKYICNMTFIRFLCDRSAYISFRIDSWNRIAKKSSPEILFTQMKVFLIEEFYDDTYLNANYGSSSRINIFYMNPIFRDYILNNINLNEWKYPSHPEDPAFYKEDGTCLMHINVHEGICFYYPIDEREKDMLNHLKINYVEKSYADDSELLKLNVQGLYK